MKYYGKIGTAQQTVVQDNINYSPAADEVLMTGERPSAEHIAQADGTWVLVQPTEEEQRKQIQQQLINAVQNWMDKTVQKRNYDNIHTACTYAYSTDETFKAEGMACLAWRDDVWRTCYNILNEVLAGTREIPTEEELLAELPVLVW